MFKVIQYPPQPCSVPSSAPLNFTKTSQSSESGITLTWSPPPIEDQNGVIIGYLLKVTEGTMDNVYQLRLQSQTYQNNTLLKFTEYTFAVAAMTAIGLGPFTDSIAVTTPEGGRSVWFI